MSVSLHPDLLALQKEVHHVVTDVDDLTRGLSYERFSRHPRPNSWSISECIDHMNVVNRRGIADIAAAIQEATTRGLHAPADAKFSHGFLSGWFIRTGIEPPPRFRVRVPRGYSPKPGKHPHEVLPEFFETHATLASVINRANGLDLPKIRVGTPMASWIRFGLYRRVQLMLAHDRRHIHQMRLILQK
jgi:hypothetical protein